MNLSDEIWFSHQPKIGDNCPTIGQFLHSISYRSDLTDEEKKDYALAHLRDDAQRWSRKAAKLDWNAFKHAITAKFNVSLKITEKVELRRNLCQDIGETCRGFLDRCIMTQFLICDDDEELVVERDILISFLLGLRPELYEALILVDNLTTLDSYFTMAAKLELDFIVEDVKKEEENEDVDDTVPFESETFEGRDDEVMSKREHEGDDKCTDDKTNKLEQSLDIDKPSKGGNVREDEGQLRESQENKIEKEEKMSRPKRKRKKEKRKSCHSSESEFDDSEDSSYNPDDEDEDSDNASKKPYVPLLPNYECELCGLKYKLKVKLMLHMKAQHEEDEENVPTGNITDNGKDKKKNKCLLCGLLCKSAKVLRKHLEFSHPNEALICCGHDYTSKGKMSFLLHKNYKHGKRGPDKSINCDLCDKTGLFKKSLNKHYKTDHFHTEPLPCPHCDRSFVLRHELRVHIKNVHTKEFNFQCNKCEEKFPHNGALRRHLKKAHGIGPDYVCEECGKAFNHKETLYHHRRNTHSGLPPKKAICEQCGFVSSCKSALNIHILRHIEEKLFECPNEDCDKKYASSRLLRNHLKKAHSEKKATHKCSKCDKSFIHKASLKRHHETIHLNLRKHQCDKCDFATGYLGVFKDHVKVMHENLIYDCNIDGCKFVAKYKYNLSKHMKAAHQIPLPGEIREMQRKANIAIKKAHQLKKKNP